MRVGNSQVSLVRLRAQMSPEDTPQFRTYIVSRIFMNM